MRCMLRLTGPLKLRIEMRIVSVGLLARILVGLRSHQSDGWVVDALFVGVSVVLDLTWFFLRLPHRVPFASGVRHQKTGCHFLT